MSKLDYGIKSLIDSLEYQISRLHMIEISPENLDSAERTLANLKNLYNEYNKATGNRKSALERELLNYIKTPKVMPTIYNARRWLSALGLLGILFGGAFTLSKMNFENPNPEDFVSDSIDNEKEFKITFSDGTDIICSESYSSNNDIFCPEPTKKEGQAFLGWFYEDGNIYHDGDIIDSDTVLQAKWMNLKFSNINDFKTYCDNKLAELNNSSICVINENVCAFSFLNASDYLELIDVIKYNANLFSIINVTIPLTPEDAKNIPKFPTENTHYRFTLKGDFTNFPLKDALINLNFNNISLKEAQISEEDLEYFINIPDVFLSICNSQFPHWKKLDSLRSTDSIPKNLKVTINDDMGSNFIFLTGENVTIILPADQKTASIICNSEKTIVDLEIEDSKNLNNININSMDSKEIEINVTLKDGYKGDIKSDSNFITFLGMFLSKNPMTVKIENTGEIISVISDYNGYFILDTNFKEQTSDNNQAINEGISR